MRRQADNVRPDSFLLSIDPDVVEIWGSQSDLHTNVAFRLGGSTFPLTMFYKILTPSSMIHEHSKSTKSDLRTSNHKSTEKEILIERVSMEWTGHPSKATHSPINSEESRKGWIVVDKEKLHGYVRKQMTLRETEEERKRSNAKPINRHAKKGDATGHKHEKIRNMNKRKWKWFYSGRKSQEYQSLCHAPSENDIRSDYDKSVDDAHAKVMAWLMELDFNEYICDLS